jgi:shikimate kinase
MEPIEKKIVLIGMPGSGKTTVGQALANRADLPFFDTDAMIAEALDHPVSTLIENKGEAYFRHKEALVVQRLLRPFYGVLATGGGAVLDLNTRPLFAAHAVVYLRATPETLAERLGTAEGRPLLKGQGTLLEQLQNTLAARQPVYEALSQLTIDVDTLTASQIVEAIAAHFDLLLDESCIVIDA